MPDLIGHAFLALFSISACEAIYASRLINTAHICINTIQKISKTILSRNISDHWKEKVLLRYSQILLFQSFRICAVLALLVFVYYVLASVDKRLAMYLVSIAGILETTAIVLIYTQLRRPAYAQLQFLAKKVTSNSAGK